MPDLLIIQPGEKLDSLSGVVGDFADWVADGMGVSATAARVVHPHRGEALPALADLKAVVITGSSAMITDRAPWMLEGEAWLRTAAQADRVILGICFGHQWLASALGGRVADNPRGAEVGTVSIRLDDDAAADPLLGDLPETLALHASHRQSVVALPPGAVHLAASRIEANHAFRWGRKVWGVQFHPEFSPAVIRGYIDYHATAVRAAGRDPDGLLDAVVDVGFGGRILRRFAQLAEIGQD